MLPLLNNEKSKMMMMRKRVMMNGVMMIIRYHRLLRSRKNSTVKQKVSIVTAKPRTKNHTIIIITTRKTGLIHMENTSIENGMAVRQVIVVWIQDNQFLLRMVRKQCEVSIQSVYSE